MPNHNERLRAFNRMCLPGFPIEEPFKSTDEVREYLHGEKITCLICGKPYRAITTHLKVHDMTTDDYREKYKIPYTIGLVSSASHKQRSSKMKNRIKNGLPVYTSDPDLQKKLYMARDRENERPSLNRTKLSEEEKARLCANSRKLAKEKLAKYAPDMLALRANNRKKYDSVTRNARKFRQRRSVLSGFPKPDKFNTAAEVEAYFAGEEVQCLLCGKHYRKLIPHLRDVHELDATSYKERYGIPQELRLISKASALAYSRGLRAWRSARAALLINPLRSTTCRI